MTWESAQLVLIALAAPLVIVACLPWRSRLLQVAAVALVVVAYVLVACGEPPEPCDCGETSCECG